MPNHHNSLQTLNKFDLKHLSAKKVFKLFFGRAFYKLFLGPVVFLEWRCLRTNLFRSWVAFGLVAGLE